MGARSLERHERRHCERGDERGVTHPREHAGRKQQGGDQHRHFDRRARCFGGREAVALEEQLPREEGVVAVPQTAVVASLYGDFVYVVRPADAAPAQPAAR